MHWHSSCRLYLLLFSYTDFGLWKKELKEFVSLQRKDDCKRQLCFPLLFRALFKQSFLWQTVFLHLQAFSHFFIAHMFVNRLLKKMNNKLAGFLEALQRPHLIRDTLSSWHFYFHSWSGYLCEPYLLLFFSFAVILDIRFAHSIWPSTFSSLSLLHFNFAFPSSCFPFTFVHFDCLNWHC